MNALGKSIRIYLKDGTVTGIKHGEVVNQTIKAIFSPRTRIAELAGEEEAKKPGLYFLFGQSLNSATPKVYIGEAENVYQRLKEHIAKKEFWHEVIFFVSKDENLTKAHVKYLESRSIQLAFAIKRYEVENCNQAQLPSLPLADRDAMEEFLTYVKLLLGTLGHKVLEEITISHHPNEFLIHAPNTSSELVSEEGTKVFLSVSAGIQAQAIQTDEGLVVLKGSEAAIEYTPNLQPGYIKLRQDLITKQDLMLVAGKYLFQNDVLFKTASPAAAVIVGYNINGPKHWKSASGKSLKQMEDEKLAVHVPFLAEEVD